MWGYDLISAIAKALDARKELLKCKSSCEYDSGYFCSSYQDDYDNCVNDVKSMIQDIAKESPDKPGY